MGIDSSSSLDDIQAQYLDNVDYEETGDVAKARRFVTACRALILKRPKSVGYGSETLSLSDVKSQLESAQRFLRARKGGSSRFYSAGPGYRR